jgi:hypothetical protein
MTECTMSYVPQIGYMLIVQPWRREEPLSEKELDNQPDLQFIVSKGFIQRITRNDCNSEHMSHTM